LSSSLIPTGISAEIVLKAPLMTLRRNIGSALAILLSAMSGCVHTPPGTSVELALAKKAELIRLPNQSAVTASGHKTRPPEPELPNLDDRIEAVAEAYTRGKFAMADGHDKEAIAAFEETVRLDPTHTEAWQSLALLYERTGSEKKAMAAYRKSKGITTQ
jgi:DNA-binding SARP family transcriptional activator